MTEWSERPSLYPHFNPANLERIDSLTLAARIRSYSRSYYSADQKLRLQQINRDSIVVHRYLEEDALPSWGAYDEFWYDALGRRILKRTRQDYPVCAFDDRCESKIERYIWDGDHLLWEVRQPNATDSKFYDETVGYVQAGGIDAPLGFLKNGIPLVLHRNWQGLFVMATDTLGQNTTCDEGEYPPACTPFSWPGVSWNTRNQVVDHKEVQIWYGSLPKGQQDRTGLIYRRNRYYDSGSGQFTQEDPIGIAGGVNQYGYANGDPTTYSDPFGLCPDACVLEGLFVTTVVIPSLQLVGAAILAGAGAYAGKVLADWRGRSDDDSWAGLSEGALVGKSAAEVGQMIPGSWAREPTSGAGGTRYVHPTNKGDQIRVMPGQTSDPNPVKKGPYVRISRDGRKSDPIPLRGNPTLEEEQ